MITKSIRFALLMSVLVTAVATRAMAAHECYLKIQGVKGSVSIVKLTAAGGKLTGSFHVSKGGAYTLSLTDATGASLSIDQKTAASGGVALTAVITAREVGSGMATGKRQHLPPITINRTYPPGRPKYDDIANLGSVSIGDLNGDGMADIIITVTSSDGRVNKVEALLLKQS